MAQRKPRGSGSVRIKNGNWYGRFYIAGKRRQVLLSRARTRGVPDGMTEAQAYKALGDLIREAIPAPDKTVTIKQAGAALVAALEDRNRSKSHRETVESHVRVHLVPHFKTMTLDSIGRREVESLKRSMRAKGKSAKTIRNVLSTLYSIFTLAERERWATENPVRMVDKPEVSEDGDIRFLDHGELALLLREGAADPEPPDDDANPQEVERWRTERAWRRVERVLYRAAAETGLRMGELLALRRLDIDWLSIATEKCRWIAIEKCRSGGSSGVGLAGLAEGLESAFETEARAVDGQHLGVVE